MASSKRTTTLDLSDSGLVTAAQAAEILGTSLGYVWALTHRGILKNYRIGRTSIYKRAEIESYRDTHPKLGAYLQS